MNWYWTPKRAVDLRMWANNGLQYKPDLPVKDVPIPFYRFRKIDPDVTRKVAWDSELRGIFDVNVSRFYSFCNIYIAILELTFSFEIFATIAFRLKDTCKSTSMTPSLIPVTLMM